MKGFDREAVYDAEINPLMAQIIAICKKHGIPMYATFNYAYDAEEDDAQYCSTFMPDVGPGRNEALVVAHKTLLRTKIDGEYIPPPLIMTTFKAK